MMNVSDIRTEVTPNGMLLINESDFNNLCLAYTQAKEEMQSSLRLYDELASINHCLETCSRAYAREPIQAVVMEACESFNLNCVLLTHLNDEIAIYPEDKAQPLDRDILIHLHPQPDRSIEFS